MNDENIDLQIISLIKLGGAERDRGVSKLYDSYANDFRRFFLYKCGNTADADDLVQETFVKVVRSIETYRGESAINSWLWQIARNCLIDYWRYKKVKPTVDLDEDGWSSLESKPSPKHEHNPLAKWLYPIVEDDIDKDSIQDCFSRGYGEFVKIDPDRAYALSLVVNGYDTKKISSFLNRTEGATREYLSQCRKKIEAFLLPCRELLVVD